MTIDEIEDLAFKGAELPSDLNFAEKYLFLAFRNLYDYAKRIQMPREQGRREKLAILAAHSEYQTTQDMALSSADMFIRTEAATIAYTKNPTIENADEMVIAIHGVLARKTKIVT